MSDHVETFEEFNDDERLLLEAHIKKNEVSQPEKFTTLYWIVSAVTVIATSYLFQSVIDLNFLEPLNFLIFLLSGGATVYLLSESYLSMYEIESSKAAKDANGLWIRDLEAKIARKVGGIKDQKCLQNVRTGVPRTALEIFKHSGRSQDQWKTLGKDEKQTFFDQEAAEECQALSGQVAELKHLQYQQTMGYSLLACNVVFCGLSTLLAVFFLRGYDARVNYGFSTFVCGVVTQILVKRNEEKVSAAKKTN